MMYTVIDERQISRYRVLVLNDVLPSGGWSIVVVDGKQYKPVPIIGRGLDAKQMDMVAIETSESFLGKKVDFI